MQAQAQRALIAALCDPGRYPHPIDRVEHRETHSAHVLLAGDYAYKIKKPVDLGFLDFSTLSKRHHYCQEELRLNARLAPIYLSVVAITGTPDDPVLGGDGEAIEWAVKMARFDENRQLDRLLASGDLNAGAVEALARKIADFHASAATAAPDSAHGTPASVAGPMRENFEQIAPALDNVADRDTLAHLARWTEERLAALGPTLERRRAEGRIRECHGDMHLGNMMALDDGVAVFDCIEFNAELRWIDVASDIAFAVMDLDHGGAATLAGRFLDAWLAQSGDYGALEVLQPYLVYRALVRAKTSAIRLGQATGADEAEDLRAQLRSYLALADRYAGAHAPAVILAHGVAGTGKSTAAAVLIERIGAIRLRADVERRRLYPDPDPAVRYAEAAHDAVYTRLETLAGGIADAGFPVVIDATFIEHARRAPFERLAAERGIPWRILDLQVPAATIERRIEARQRAGADPSEADITIMRRQWERLEPLGEDECRVALPVDNAGERPRVPPTGLAHARGQDGDDDI